MTITLCLLGDDRERTYPVLWLGWGEVGFPVNPERRVAIIVDHEREKVVYKHPRYGWISLNAESLRDTRPSRGYPALTDERLEAAA